MPLWGASHKPVGQSSSTRLPCEEDLALLRRGPPPLFASALLAKGSGSQGSACTPLQALNSAFGLVCERRMHATKVSLLRLLRRATSELT